MSKSTTISTFQLFQAFPDKESARVYFEQRLWPNGVVCPVCKSGKRITTRKGGYYRCNACEEDFTVRTGTVMERSHIPLHKWLYAMYLLVTARKGISSTQLAKEIGVTQKSAWFMLHRLRVRVLVAPSSQLARVRRAISSVKAKPPKALDAIVDVVLTYKPKAKSKPARRRKRRANKIAKHES